MQRISDRLAFLSFSVTLSASSLVAAQTPPPPPSCDSADHVHGRELRNQGRDLEAHNLFRDVFARDHTICAEVRMGLAAMALGRWVEAESALVEGLSHPQDPWIVAQRAQLESQLEEIRLHVGEYEPIVDSDVHNAELWVNGRRMGTLPLPHPVRLNSGSAIVEVRATGYESTRHTVQIDAGHLNRETVDLVPVAATTTLTPNPEATTHHADTAMAPVTSSVSPAAQAGAEEHHDQPAAGGGSSGLRTLGIAGMVSGAVLVVGGLSLLGYAWYLHSSFTDPRYACNATPPGNSLCGFAGQYQTPFEYAGGAIAITGGVVLAGSLILFLVSGSHSSASHATNSRRNWAIEPQLGGATLRVSF